MIKYVQLMLNVFLLQQLLLTSTNNLFVIVMKFLLRNNIYSQVVALKIYDHSHKFWVATNSNKPRENNFCTTQKLVTDITNFLILNQIVKLLAVINC